MSSSKGFYLRLMCEQGSGSHVIVSVCNFYDLTEILYLAFTERSDECRKYVILAIDFGIIYSRSFWMFLGCFLLLFLAGI